MEKSKICWDRSELSDQLIFGKGAKKKWDGAGKAFSTRDVHDFEAKVISKD